MPSDPIRDLIREEIAAYRFPADPETKALRKDLDQLKTTYEGHDHRFPAIEDVVRENATLREQVRALTETMARFDLRLSRQESHKHPDFESAVASLKTRIDATKALQKATRQINAMPAMPALTTLAASQNGKKKHPIEGFVRCPDCDFVYNVEEWRNGIGEATKATVVCPTPECGHAFSLPGDILVAET